MDNKFYVSLEAARLLKEKGYNEVCDCAIDEDGDIYTCEYRRDQDLPEWKWSCPTLLEAMDWLESKDIHLEIRMQHCKVKGDPYKVTDDDEYQWKYYYAICKGSDVEHPIVEVGDDDYVILHTDRNECMQKAIEKALTLL